MNRYFIVNEFFGLRLYDSVEKSETYFSHEMANEVKEKLNGNYIEINHTNSHLSVPLKISMNITKNCNLRCEQCFSDSGIMDEDELTTEEVCSLFDTMREHGTFFICIGGGEPLMREDLLELLDYGKEKQLAISIVSNGLLLTRKLINELNKKDLDTFWISIDGLEKNHDRLRGKGTFKRTLEALPLLKDNFNAKKAIRVSLNKYNIGEFRQIIDIAEANSFDLIRFTPLLEYGRAKDKSLTITQNQYIDFLKEIKHVESDIKIVHPGIKNTVKFWVNTDDFGCHCGKEAVWIDEKGNYSPCIFLGDSFWLGNIRNDSYAKLWEKSLDVTTIRGNEVCKNCSNYTTCRGGCRARVYNEFGDLNGIDPLCPLMRNIPVKQDLKT
jgi:AdoMet-dependent heme synthase